MEIKAKGYLSPLTEEAKTSLWVYIKEWLCSTDAKRIGVMYLIFSLIMGIVGAVLSVMIRAQLAEAGPSVITDASFYNALPGFHATAMIFFFIIPAYTGLGNFVVPIQIGAPDMAFPKLNLAAFWILPPAALVTFMGFFINSLPEFGWTGYPPLSTNAYSPLWGADFWVLGLILVGVSSTMAAVNFLATIFNMRCKGMKIFQLPLFTWSLIVTSFLSRFGCRLGYPKTLVGRIGFIPFL